MTHTLADYDFALVGLSFVVALIGALVGLFTSQYVRDEDGEIRLVWTVFCAVIFAGCMMWAAHFTGMLAYQPDAPVTFGVRMTWLSFVMPAIFAAVAVLIVSRHPESTAVLIIGGAVMTMGFVALHYGGVAALRVPAEISHEPSLVIVSVLLAFVVSTAGLFVMSALDGWPRFLSAPIMAAAVCVMHYTGMAAIEPLSQRGEVEYFEGALTPSTLTIWVVAATLAVVVIGVILGVVGYLQRQAERRRRESAL